VEGEVSDRVDAGEPPFRRSSSIRRCACPSVTYISATRSNVKYYFRAPSNYSRDQASTYTRLDVYLTLRRRRRCDSWFKLDEARRLTSIASSTGSTIPRLAREATSEAISLSILATKTFLVAISPGFRAAARRARSCDRLERSASRCAKSFFISRPSSISPLARRHSRR